MEPIDTRHPDVLRSHLARLLDRSDAHGDFDSAIDGLSPDLYGRRPSGLPYSPWQLLEHLRLTQRDILDFCTNPDYVEPKWPDDYWPEGPAPHTPEAWPDAVADFRSDRNSLIELAMNSAVDLFDQIPHGEGQTFLREILLAADHAAYHVGQMIILRRLLGAWKDESRDINS